MSVFKKFSRLFYVIIALVLGYFVVYGLAAISKRSKGPIGALLENASDLVQSLEHRVILEEREVLREDKLTWFENQRKNKDSLINSKIILFGASDDSQRESYENIFKLEDSLALTFPIIHIYKAWGEKPEHKFPENEIDAIYRIGSIPMITWEPWLNKFTQENFPKIDEVDQRDKHGMTTIANGYYDSFLKEWANDVKKVEHPVYLRLGHEMNDPYRYPWGPQNSDPSEYIDAWKHVHDVFDKEGVKNVIWVWSPHLAYGKFKEYYPGDEYVDVVATGALNYGTSTGWSKWWSFKQIFGNFYKDLAFFNKPIMIAEFGSLKPGGNRAEWFGDAFHDFHEKYPLVNTIVFFHYSNDGTTTYKSVSWYIREDEEVTNEIKKQLKSWDAKIKQPDIQ
ncbi:glycoside hydrolase family 26 protein [Wenyingzhuangia sp. 2_MG-2023]|uniref:glycoside hydrolase family 26 protein n=1 Tax=Wenyingzhuangia sp. 2_MG-2023 TaxID=3062639 RepID=UPI0026E3EF77|nr:glycosyl hydrolase [Wenyingzhuangia sp. 2_MG-2023]MDO6738374.1 glycosyl hydrolase [Wenyingzhuangia sp. 2_MG-2023]